MQRFKLHDFEVEDLPDDGIMTSFELEDDEGQFFTVSVAGDNVVTGHQLMQALLGAAKHLKSLGEAAIIPNVTEHETTYVH